ncbi:CARDB domain-containing protein [Haloarcula laminariae]|uniref:CARDB domain-containing protein n=1 Tax=Haloarcula laminariae TaxID=2961577 RepID=UPI0021C8156E|nr:CARDB domain-containing protein [Halomicroarcula laminariae]
MRRTERGWVAGAWTLLLVVSMAGSAVAGGAAVSTASAAEPAGQTALSESAAPTTGGSLAAANATGVDGDIVRTGSYALTPDRPGSVRVTITYELPDRVGSLRTFLVDDGTVTDTDGFDRVNDTTYDWDESTARPSITLRYNPNETTSKTGPEAAGGQYLFADTGEWALIRQFRTSSRYSYSGSQPGVDRRARTDGPGATGDRIVFLGDVRTVERTQNGQTFRLVVPEAAELSESPESILDSLTNASRSLQVGNRDETVVGFAAPTDRVEWGVRGLATGDAEFWVRDFERLGEPANVWLHEYVHTRQAFRTTSETRWLTEATAQYYAAGLTLEQGRIDFEAFERELARGERSTYDDVVLSSPSTWAANANYVKGALAAGRLDLALREGTNQSATLQRVMRELNEGQQPVTQTAFLEAVEAAGGAEPRATAAELSETSEPLSMWNQRTHSRLFGTVPAQMRYGLPSGADGYRASGPYRNDTLSTPVRLATGERLTVDAVVENTGGEAGAYNATLTVDGRAVASASGQLDAGGERTVPLSHTFDRPGEYTLGVGGETTTVVVEEPAEPTVSGVRVDSERVRAGESVRVTATVRNDAAVPANGTVTFTRDGEPVAERAVALAPGATTELSADIELPTAGERRVGAGSATPVTVTVTTPTDGPAGTSGGSGPGFTAPVAALAAVLALLARRR